MPKNNPIQKEETINSIYAALVTSDGKLTKKLVREIYEELGKRILIAAEQKRSIRVPGLGTIAFVERDSRIARSPKTGEPVTVPAKCVPRLVASSYLKEAANKPPF